MTYHSICDILELSVIHQLPFWKVVLAEDAKERQVSEEASFEMMRQMYLAMKEADASYDKDLYSASGLAGGDGEKLHQFNQSGKQLCSDFTSLAMEKAIKMGESNACMKRIVAAPTAGSCGVIPSVFLAYQECFACEENTIIEALFISAGIGAVIAENASISGAQGGCQAEIGSASAMAAAGLIYLCGGNNEMIAQGVAFALKNMLGLACDPVCGLVEVPCIKRNASGAVNAIAASQWALAGIKSAISPDEVIESMNRIGRAMPSSLKETSQDGLAVTETAKRIKEQLSE